VLDDRAVSAPEYLAALSEAAGPAGLGQSLGDQFVSSSLLAYQLSEKQPLRDVPIIASEKSQAHQQGSTAWLFSRRLA
jgi:hypothetical protein